MLFAGLEALGRIAVAAFGAYFALILILRLAGKRSLAKLNAFDFAVTVAFGSALATVILSKDVSLSEGLLALAALAGLQYAVATLSLHSRLVRRLVRSTPALLVDEGRYLGAEMRRERVTQGEIDAAIRSHGVGRIEESPRSCSKPTEASASSAAVAKAS